MLELVLNNVSPVLSKKVCVCSMEDAHKWLAIPLLGYIVEDNARAVRNNRGLPLAVARDSQVYHCFDVPGPPLSQREGRAAKAE